MVLLESNVVEFGREHCLELIFRKIDMVTPIVSNDKLFCLCGKWVYKKSWATVVSMTLEYVLQHWLTWRTRFSLGLHFFPFMLGASSYLTPKQTIYQEFKLK